MKLTKPKEEQMKTIVLIFCVLMVVASISAKTDMNFRYDFAEFTNENWGEFSRELTTYVIGLRDEYVLEVLYEDWIDEAWLNEHKDVYTYDGNSYAIEILTLTWEDNTSTWQNSLKMVMTNNVQGYPTEMIYQMWEPTTQVWMDMMMISYTYDANWNMTEMLNQMWYGTEWINGSRYTMTYNVDNNPTYVLQEIWDFPGGTEWELDDQETYTYDGLFLEEIFEEHWDGSAWENDRRITYTLEGNYHPADRLQESWNGGGYWDNQRYSQYTYDGDWNEIEDYEQEWDNGGWVNFQTHYYTYDGDLLIERLTHEWEADRSWVVHDRYTVTYGTLDSDDNTISPNDLLLTNYPNPFNPETTISFNLGTEQNQKADLEIFNLKGQKIRQFSIQNHQSSIVWDGRDEGNKPVSSGIYFYKLRADNLEQAKKMILMK